MKKFLFVAITLLLILFPCSRSYASMAVPLPAYPYIPPETGDILDIIFNSFGVNAPDISDNETKVEAYYKLLLNSGVENAADQWVQLMYIVDKAKTGRKIVIDSASNFSTIRKMVKKAVNSGVQYGKTWENAVNVQQVVTMLDQRYHITCPQSVMQQVFDRASASGMSNFGVSYGIWGDRIWFFVLNRSYSTMHVGYYRNGFYYFMDSTNEPQAGYFLSYEIANRIVVTGLKEEYYGGHSFPTAANEYGTCNASAGSIASVTAVSSDVNSYIQAETVLPVSADTVPSSVLSSPSIVINLPAINIYPADTVADVPAVQDQLQIVTVSDGLTQEQIAEIVEQLQESQAVAYGDILDYGLDLTEYFPFCIPFDIGRAINLLVAEPEAPKFTFPFPSGYENGEIIYTEQTIDLSIFDPVAAVLRAGLVILFCVGLGMLTRQVFLRG